MNIYKDNDFSHKEIIILLNSGRRPLWLRSANLEGALLVKADLIGADMSRANLRNAELSQADLSGADLSYAVLTNADLSKANLSGANMLHCDMSNVDLANAKYTVDTRWPKDFNPELHGAILRNTHPH
ncbi:MAG: hypothetical protein CL789_04100 [Chloroflexi bacterium]|nr:hypothetical protein [Chloroflexota bacterium]MBS59730.1 hypothetical protein [Anaerolineaceae bacterium]HCU79928.1 hypothetical protein [Chloroflexota bacterium]|tara:strand:+ start:259 stop:642 length:384 start_codon:yes stop_codon:yes gene_type:complete